MKGIGRFARKPGISAPAGQSPNVVSSQNTLPPVQAASEVIGIPSFGSRPGTGDKNAFSGFTVGRIGENENGVELNGELYSDDVSNLAEGSPSAGTVVEGTGADGPFQFNNNFQQLENSDFADGATFSSAEELNTENHKNKSVSNKILLIFTDKTNRSNGNLDDLQTSESGFGKNSSLANQEQELGPVSMEGSRCFSAPNFLIRRPNSSYDLLKSSDSSSEPQVTDEVQREVPPDSRGNSLGLSLIAKLRGRKQNLPTGDESPANEETELSYLSTTEGNRRQSTSAGETDCGTNPLENMADMIPLDAGDKSDLVPVENSIGHSNSEINNAPSDKSPQQGEYESSSLMIDSSNSSANGDVEDGTAEESTKTAPDNTAVPTQSPKQNKESFFTKLLDVSDHVANKVQGQIVVLAEGLPPVSGERPKLAPSCFNVSRLQKRVIRQALPNILLSTASDGTSLASENRSHLQQRVPIDFRQKVTENNMYPLAANLQKPPQQTLLPLSVQKVALQQKKPGILNSHQTTQAQNEAIISRHQPNPMEHEAESRLEHSLSLAKPCEAQALPRQHMSPFSAVKTVILSEQQVLDRPQQYMVPSLGKKENHLSHIAPANSSHHTVQPLRTDETNPIFIRNLILPPQSNVQNLNQNPGRPFLQRASIRSQQKPEASTKPKTVVPLHTKQVLSSPQQPTESEVIFEQIIQTSNPITPPLLRATHASAVTPAHTSPEAMNWRAVKKSKIETNQAVQEQQVNYGMEVPHRQDRRTPNSFCLSEKRLCSNENEKMTPKTTAPEPPLLSPWSDLKTLNTKQSDTHVYENYSDESFNKLLSSFLTDLRDNTDLFDIGGAELLELEVELANVHSIALRCIGEMDDILESLDAVQSTANDAIREIEG